MHKIMLSEKLGYKIACNKILSKIKRTHMKKKLEGCIPKCSQWFSQGDNNGNN